MKSSRAALLLAACLLLPAGSPARTLDCDEARELARGVRDLTRAGSHARARSLLESVDGLAEDCPYGRYSRLVNQARRLYRKSEDPAVLRWARRFAGEAARRHPRASRVMLRTLARELDRAGIAESADEADAASPSSGTPGGPDAPLTAPRADAPASPEEAPDGGSDRARADELARRAVEHMDRGEHARALPLLRKAVSLWPPPGDHRVFCDLGSTLLVLGEEPLSEAETWLRRSLALREDFFKVHQNLAVVLARSGRHDEALGHFQRAAELAPEDASCQYNLAYALEQGYLRERSRLLLTRALRPARRALRPSDTPKHRRLVDRLEAERRRGRHR